MNRWIEFAYVRDFASVFMKGIVLVYNYMYLNIFVLFWYLFNFDTKN